MTPAAGEITHDGSERILRNSHFDFVNGFEEARVAMFFIGAAGLAFMARTTGTVELRGTVSATQPDTQSALCRFRSARTRFVPERDAPTTKIGPLKEA